MNHLEHQGHQQHQSGQVRFWRSRYGVAFLVIAAAAAYFLLKEHRAHVFSYLPYLLLLACPLMHLFMHHGHGSHDHGTPASKPDATDGNAGDPRSDRP